MSTVLAGAVLTVITATSSIFSGLQLNLNTTIFTSMKSCTAYAKSQQTSDKTWETTVSDQPELYYYRATRSMLFSAVALSIECAEQE